MAQYRKKPVVIEAFKYGIDPRPDWFNDKVTDNEIILPSPLIPSERYCYVKTLEGVMRGDYGDYIIQGIKGEIYPCKPEIFEMTYEEVKDQTNDLEKLTKEQRERVEKFWSKPALQEMLMGSNISRHHAEQLLCSALYLEDEDEFLVRSKELGVLKN